MTRPDAEQMIALVTELAGRPPGPGAIATARTTPDQATRVEALTRELADACMQTGAPRAAIQGVVGRFAALGHSLNRAERRRPPIEQETAPRPPHRAKKPRGRSSGST